jgi:hypothetical protein
MGDEAAFGDVGDEARLHFLLAQKIKVAPGPYPAPNSPPDCWI